jgi:hypothetical protein
MHILFQSHEKTYIEMAVVDFYIPSGSTLVETNNDSSTVVYSYIVKDNLLMVSCDHKEQDRKWKKGECEEFEKNITPDKVRDFFVCDINNNTPQRKYVSYRKLENKYFKYIKYSGNHVVNKEKWSVFQTYINKDSDLKEVKKEFLDVLGCIQKNFPCRESIRFTIMEYTLSQYGCCSFDYHPKNKEYILEHSYKSSIKFDNVMKLLEYIQKHYYCE